MFFIFWGYNNRPEFEYVGLENQSLVTINFGRNWKQKLLNIQLATIMPYRFLYCKKNVILQEGCCILQKQGNDNLENLPKTS